MEIFNIGIPELIFICIIALVVLGPENLTKTAQQLGRWISRLTKSPIWHDLISTSREIRDLPTKIVREAGLEQSLSELQNETNRISGEVSTQFTQAMVGVQASIQDAQAQPNTKASMPYQPMLPPYFPRQDVVDGSTKNDPENNQDGHSPVMNQTDSMIDNLDQVQVIDQPSKSESLAVNLHKKVEIILPLGPKV